MESVRVRHIMTGNVISIGIDEPVSEVLRIFASHALHHLPVVEGAALKGMLSSADLLKLEYFLPKAAPSGASAPAVAALLDSRFRIATLMRQPVITAGPDDTLASAAASMSTHGIHSLPVVDGAQRLVGIITTTDIILALLSGVQSRPEHTATARTAIPSDLELRHAIEAAQAAALNGTDRAGIAQAMLYLHERNALLEELRRDLSRYLRGGQDEHLHARLLRAIDRLDQQKELPLRM